MLRVSDAVAEVVFDRGMVFEGLFTEVNAAMMAVRAKLTQAEYNAIESAVSTAVSDAAERGFVMGVKCMQNPASVFLKETTAQEAFSGDSTGF